MSTHDSDDCLQQMEAAPYVLGALEQDELQRYRRHLEDCVECRAEVAELQVVVDELPASVPIVAAPAALSRRILATVRSEAELLSAAGLEADRPQRPVGKWRSRRFSLAGASAALTATAIVLAAIVLGTGSSSKEIVTPGTTEGPARTAQVALHRRDGHAVLVVSKMPQPALGKIYEVWLRHGATAAPSPTNALFSPTGRGSGEVEVPSKLHGVNEVLVTSEPLGGSMRPTSSPVIRVVLSA